MVMLPPPSDLVAGLSSLSINTRPKQSSSSTTQCKRKTKGTKEVAESWEDENLSDDDEPAASESSTPCEPTDGHSASIGTVAPPPTPISLTHIPSPSLPLPYVSERLRPEKTDSVARRMIANALGMRVPHPTEDQQAYEKSVREKEKKRREEEKERLRREEEEKGRARAAVWED